jgi:glycerate kinase
MTVLIAPDKFKGSLSAAEVCAAIKEGLHAVDSSLRIVTLPLADGGEGTCELLTHHAGGSIVSLEVRDPLFRPIQSQYGISKDGKTAFLEMAKASGLQLLAQNEQNPMITSTVGTGDLIRHALDNGVEELIMGVGGSATTDGGMGMAEALGIVFYDSAGEKLRPVGSNLNRIHRLDMSGIHSRLKDIRFTIFCDVDNPLHGPKGAAYVFSPQKGADSQMVALLDQGLAHYQEVVEQALAVKVNFPGAGAGGGLPATVKALTEVLIRPGMEFIIEFTSLEKMVADADVVVTGEGKIDDQTLSGKVVKGVASLASRHKKPVIAIAGKSLLDDDSIQALGITRLMMLTGPNSTEKESMENAYAILRERASELARNWPL